ncbi:MAG: DUF429 domain-containing protein [Nitrososphaerota archaeon]|jgi:predicted nuclease with RNAse H fold|nr:DUF429 domain-containing protein [Nitrososphaerota archaeon]
MISVGIDLAGSPSRNTGYCVLDDELNCSVSILHTDSEILSNTLKLSPDIVSIDAPLFLPKGRLSLEQTGPPHLRGCDRELLKMGIKFFPITLGPMRMLTSRGMKLRSELERTGLSVIESFPGAIQDLLGMPRKQRGLDVLRMALIKYGIKGGIMNERISGDELDAITSAVVGKMYLSGAYRAIGDPEEGFMIIPNIASNQSHMTGGSRR